MKTMWSFKTAHFTVEWLIERDVLNTDYMDSDLADECRANVRSGEWKCFSSTIQVVHRATKRVLSESYLGNSIYADPREFRDHFGMNGKGYGSYFSDMVREAVADARKVFPAFQKEAKAEINRQARALNCTLKTGLAQEVCHG